VNFIVRHPDIVAARFGEHVLLTFVSLAIALAIAFPLGVLTARNQRAGAITLAVLNVIYTIPSLALLAILVAIFGLGMPTAVVALVAYAQMILVRNVAAGLLGVSPAALDAADGLGYTRFGRLIRIEIPLALPAIVGGIRIATVSLIGIATVARGSMPRARNARLRGPAPRRSRQDRGRQSGRDRARACSPTARCGSSSAGRRAGQ